MFILIEFGILYKKIKVHFNVLYDTIVYSYVYHTVLFYAGRETWWTIIELNLVRLDGVQANHNTYIYRRRYPKAS